ncbi:MAG: sensor histidine kinase [Solirubrobacteraceae bacterium]
MRGSPLGRRLREEAGTRGRLGAGERFGSSFDRLPIRTRLAGVSALLTFVILFSFGFVVGSLTIHRIRTSFDNEFLGLAQHVFDEINHEEIHLQYNPQTKQVITSPSSLESLAGGHATAIKILGSRGGVLAHSSPHLPSFGPPQEQPIDVNGYRVISQPVRIASSGFLTTGMLQYAESLANTESTVARVELLLFLGVLAGTGLALLAGIVLARRAMAPISQLTSSAAQIARTRDASTALPQPVAEDEVSELSHTLQGMLRELGRAQAETEAMLHRQRQFVADASHELRTPLTSVLANLELLAESLRGEEADAASSALRSSRRMRRLVADLLLLARTDVGRVVRREPADLAEIAVEAAGELGPLTASHEITLDVQPARIEAARDEVLRVVLNLIENAVRHTPDGTEIRVSTGTDARGTGTAGTGTAGTGTGGTGTGGTGTRGRATVALVVEDDGPGVPEQLRESLFQRFIRGGGDHAGSFGLGLAIVKAVAESHGGGVSVEPTHPHPRDGRAPYGARFTVAFPAAGEAGGVVVEGSDLHDDGEHHRPPAQPVVDQLR